MAVEDAVMSALAWQRDAEARIARAERELANLQLAEQARPQVVPPPPVLPKMVAAPPPAHDTPLTSRAAPPWVEKPVSVPVHFEDEPFDAGRLPDELNGGRRKRALAWGALILFLTVLGTLVSLAIVSQAKHGL